MTQLNAADALKLAKKYMEKEELTQAEQVFNALLQIDSHNAEASHYLGIIQVKKGDLAKGLELLKRAVELDRSNALYHNNLGEIYRQAGQLQHAEFHLGAAVELKPKYSDAYSNLGLLFREKGDVRSAKFCFAEALSSNPKNVNALINTGNLLRGEKEYSDSLECYFAALEITPENAIALSGAAISCYELGRYNESAKFHSKIIQLKPENHRDRSNLGLITLRNKDFRKGFQLFESRFHYLDILEGDRDSLWRGTGQKDEILYVYAEREGLHGFGDTIMLSRYLKDMEKFEASKIVFKVQPELTELIRDSIPDIEVTSEKYTDFKKHIPLFSLPMILNARAKTIPHQGGYLKADAEKTAKMAELMKSERIKIGIASQTSREHINYGERSIPVNAFSTLYNSGKYQVYYISREEPEDKLPPSVTDMREHLNYFSDTAAVIENLDAVISADTSAAHLAGAMGKKTFLILNKLHDWRWFNAKTGKKSEWYSSVTFHIKESDENWADVISSIDI